MMPRSVCLTILIAGLAGGQTAPPAFDVVSVKHSSPGQTGGQFQLLRGGRLPGENTPLDAVIQDVYGVRSFQIAGSPAMIAIIADGYSARYDIQATAAESATADQMREMVKTMLADRFQLKVHHETRELPVYELVPAKSGIKLSAAKDSAQSLSGIRSMARGWIESSNVTMQSFINILSRSVGRPIVDKTGYTDGFEFRLTWTPDDPGAQTADGASGSCPVSWDALQQRIGPGPAPVNSPSLFTAIQEQMGLKLDPQKDPIEMLVIDHVERPSEN